MTVNPYAEGTIEWHAWGLGHDHGSSHDAPRDYPLSGEWADDPNPHDIIRKAWRAVMGPSWDTYTHGTEDDRDGDETLLDAFETGYFAAFPTLL